MAQSNKLSKFDVSEAKLPQVLTMLDEWHAKNNLNDDNSKIGSELLQRLNELLVSQVKETDKLIMIKEYVIDKKKFTNKDWAELFERI